MRLSIRNQIPGTVVGISKGEAMAVVRVDVQADQTLTSSITVDALEDLGIEVGSKVTILIKATDLALAVD